MTWVFSSEAGKHQHLSAVPGRGGFHGDQGWGWQERRARRRFLCCAFVSGGSGIAFLRVSARWEAPSHGFSLVGVPEWVQGCQLCCVTGAGGDQPELEERMGRDELHPNLGIPVHPSWVPTQDPEWGSAVHVIPVKCQLGSSWLRCRCAGSVRFLGCCYHRTNQSSC